MGVIRLLLAAAVIIAHSKPIFGAGSVGGIIAVETFFIISGFYMALVLEEKYFHKKDYYKLFITNRFLKLYPIYWGVLLLTLLISLCIDFRLGVYMEWFSHFNLISKTYVIFVNAIMFFQDTLLFMGIDLSSGEFYFAKNFRETIPQLQLFLLVPQAWTIGLELLFYLLAPFLVRLRSFSLLIILMASFLGRLVAYLIGFDNDPWTYRFFPFELGFFIAGIFSYRLYKQIQWENIRIGYLRQFYCLFLMITISFSFIPMQLEIKQWLYYGLAFLGIAPIFLLTKNSAIDRLIGDLSYPMYMSHILVITIITIFFERYRFIMDNLGFFSVMLTMIFSYVLLKIIGKPVEFLRNRRLKNALSASV